MKDRTNLLLFFFENAKLTINNFFKEEKAMDATKKLNTNQSLKDEDFNPFVDELPTGEGADLTKWLY